MNVVPADASDSIVTTNELGEYCLATPAISEGMLIFRTQHKLIAVAEAEPHQIYTGRRMAFAFERTVSRLAEMSSKNYLALPHLVEGMHHQQGCSN